VSAYVSAFELFSVGVGPSSSHTVGPMRAARDFAVRLRESGDLDRTARVRCTLFGSLGATGIGHGTPDAVVAGLRGEDPATVDPDAVRRAWSDRPDGGTLVLAGAHGVRFAKDDIEFAPRMRLPGHPNAMTLIALDSAGAPSQRRRTTRSAEASSAAKASRRARRRGRSRSCSAAPRSSWRCATSTD